MFVIPNGFDENDFCNSSPASGDCFTITYTGTMSDEYPISSFIEAVEYFLKYNPTNKVKINIIGHLSNRNESRLLNSSIREMVKIRGYVSHREAIRIMLEASALLLIIPDVNQNQGILTGKLFEYLGTKRPVLCFGPEDGDAASIINLCESGKVFDYNEKEKAGKWLVELFKNHIKGTPMTFGNDNVSQYSRQQQTKALAGIIKEVTCSKIKRQKGLS
jgi:glycosyltransferase involved in cell wall biosynthesis